MTVLDKAQTQNNKVLQRSDYASKQEVRWCPGCGDYAILASMQKVLAECQMDPANIVFVSGIGCSGRFPYYMNTYGFHTIHGRAPAVATGLKMMRPELMVWLVTGDGDAFSIGSNHLLHILRRNVDVKILLLNNQIYGLTKGQFSPTSRQGKVSVTSPAGVNEPPVDPIAYALSAGATFVARAIDTDAPGLQAVLHAASQHRGTAFIEIYQNCNIFNDGAFDDFAKKPIRADHTVQLRHQQPLIFGKNRDKAICLTELKLVQSTDLDAALLYDCMQPSPILAQLVNYMRYPEMPVPIGIFRQVSAPTYNEQRKASSAPVTASALEQMLASGHVWEVA